MTNERLAEIESYYVANRWRVPRHIQTIIEELIFEVKANKAELIKLDSYVIFLEDIKERHL